MSRTSPDVTRLLVQLKDGNRDALDRLLPIVYDELRHLARMQLRGGRSKQTLNTTALVHEAYFRLVDHHAVDWQDRSHFFAVASRAMRQVIVEYVRRRNALKRGGGRPKLTLNEGLVGMEERGDDLLALDEALSRLERFAPRQARIVECRYFGGLTVQEAAEALDLSPSTVKRDTRSAVAWLYRELSRSPDEEGRPSDASGGGRRSAQAPAQQE